MFNISPKYAYLHFVLVLFIIIYFWLNFTSSYGQDNIYQFNKNTSPNLIQFAWLFSVQLKFWLKCVIKHFHQHKYPKRNWILWKYCFSCIESTTFVFNFSNHFTSSSYNPYENLFKCLFSVYFQHLCCTYFFLLFIICFTIDTLSERNWFEYKSYKQKVLLFGSTFQLNFIYQNKFKTQNKCVFLDVLTIKWVIGK